MTIKEWRQPVDVQGNYKNENGEHKKCITTPGVKLSTEADPEVWLAVYSGRDEHGVVHGVTCTFESLAERDLLILSGSLAAKNVERGLVLAEQEV